MTTSAKPRVIVGPFNGLIVEQASRGRPATLAEQANLLKAVRNVGMGSVVADVSRTRPSEQATPRQVAAPQPQVSEAETRQRWTAGMTAFNTYAPEHQEERRASARAYSFRTGDTDSGEILRGSEIAQRIQSAQLPRAAEPTPVKSR